jgi:hypothetical protein
MYIANVRISDSTNPETPEKPKTPGTQRTPETTETTETPEKSRNEKYSEIKTTNHDWIQEEFGDVFLD